MAKLYDISTIIPAIMLALMAVILFFGYDLSKKKLVVVHTQLNALRAGEGETLDRMEANASYEEAVEGTDAALDFLNNELAGKAEAAVEEAPAQDNE